MTNNLSAWERVKQWLSPPSVSVVPMKRHYSAARVDRTHAGWTTQTTTANYEMRQSLVSLRSRARDAARNHSHFKKFLSLMRSNVIGPKGFQLQSRARSMDGSTLNVELNKRVEEAFWLWSQPETCTLSGRLDWLGVQRLIVTHLARDGEFLVQKIEADNAFGFALKVHNVDFLDETFNELVPGGNRIIMSVEIDANDKPVAYWLTPPNTDIDFRQPRARRRTRVPADEMVHSFLCYDDEAQVRGVTFFHAAMLDGKNYKSYSDGVINAARMGAHQLGFLEQDTPDDMGEWTGEENENGLPQAPMIDVTPMSFNALPPGWKMNQFKPDQPTQNHSAFAKTVLMDIATGLDVPYFNLAGDMEAVNFSSSRVGLDDARDIWRGLQDFVASTLCRPVFHAWLPNAMLTGQLKITGREYKEILNPMWRARGWKYIDPTKDVAAAVSKLENNLTTWTDELAEQGVDLVDYLERRKAEIELARTYGIELKIEKKEAQPVADKPDEDEKPPVKPKRGYTNGNAELVN